MHLTVNKKCVKGKNLPTYPLSFTPAPDPAGRGAIIFVHNL
jgi:hypothetical protein